MPDVVIPTYLKDPDAVLDWIWDWSDWLAPGETIVTSVFTVGAGLDLDSSSHNTTSATAWLSGGAPGSPYTVANRITTSASRTDERSIVIRVKNR
ncbi:hypothetical protein [Streptomyces sp. NPDC059009]|uniref:phage fiber-tail adaptor protein n=1 Tax=Streptomyces sp. NPDC059009 TaxID=3346694 RepID=UPI0036BA90D2